MALTKNQLNEWLELLRNGEVKQGYSALKGGDGYCCLGVLSEKVLGFDLEAPTPCKAGTYARSAGIINDVPPPLGAAMSAHTRALLANRNDGGATFPMIADYIEELVERGSIEVVE